MPDAIYSLRGACQKYFGITPFLLQAGVKTGLKIKYRNVLEVGADRIADAIAGTHLFPKRNLLIIDFGTGHDDRGDQPRRRIPWRGDPSGYAYFDGSAGASYGKVCPRSKSWRVDPKQILGRSTVESIQSGLVLRNTRDDQRI